ncbi:SIMPL domain-containing protein [Litorimonas sp. WD9-15]|uniref:SIMPL domain-containing protein n=1 Tax=Litorimonas sp. WD9-15 TaxID=3418716 RepID=UPI003D00E1EE
MIKYALLASALCLTACNSGAPTYITSSSAPQATVDVSATGQANVAPDRAIVSAGVVQQGKTAREAMMGNATLMTAVFDELESAGIPKSDITTSQLSLQPQYDYRDRRKPEIKGYEVRNTVTVKSDDIEQIGPMLDALVRAGVNNINQVQFTVKDPKAAKDQAREDAIREAKSKAESMAAAAGVKLGPLLSLSEAGGNLRPQPVMMRAAAMEMSSASTPVSAGEQTLSVTVNMSYGIAE